MHVQVSKRWYSPTTLRHIWDYSGELTAIMLSNAPWTYNYRPDPNMPENRLQI